jgi:predicted translin family RNA/ssDNA-binding protein
MKCSVRKIQGELPEGIKKDVDVRLDQISKLLAAMAPEVQGINRYRYNWQLMCLEELVEALTFAHYLKTQSLISLVDLRAITDDLARRGAQEDAVMADADASTQAQDAEAEAALPAAPTIHITEQDYLYGVFDLTGEMMRFATTSTALTRELAGGAGDEGTASRRRTILQDMQELGSFFEMLPQNKSKHWTSKFDVLRQSVRKVERIGYDMVVRGSEREKGWVPAGDDGAAPDE